MIKQSTYDFYTTRSTSCSSDNLLRLTKICTFRCDMLSDEIERLSIKDSQIHDLLLLPLSNSVDARLARVAPCHGVNARNSNLGIGCVETSDLRKTFESVATGDLRIGRSTRVSVKEVIQPQVPLRLPCYDFAPVTALAFGRLVPCGLPTRTSGAHSFHGVTGGVYKARERIHRGVADPRLLAIPASWSRVAASNPN